MTVLYRTISNLANLKVLQVRNHVECGIFKVEYTAHRRSIAVTSCVSLARNQRVLFVPLKLEGGPRSAETSAPYSAVPPKRAIVPVVYP